MSVRACEDSRSHHL